MTKARSKGVKDAGALGCSKYHNFIQNRITTCYQIYTAGVNQTLMLSLSMAVIAALIGAGGLGLNVYAGLTFDIGKAFVGGLGIVLIAIIDRITQNLLSNLK